jgi:FAD/FMN-containing dehydrogenase
MAIETNHPTLADGSVAELAASLRGELIAPLDDAYDEARSIWNGAHDRRPALIVRCAGVADVIRSVEFARSEQLTIAVRGGGHSIPGFSTVDDGIVIDLGAMKGIQIDPQARTARAEAGLTWAEFDHETQAFGLAVTGGLVSSTGIAGFTLGGGLGHLVRKHGLAADNLIGADVVTADGRLIHASADENPELLWALRGGGGNFGVVTALEFQLHPVGQLVLGGPVFYPGEDAEKVLRFYRDFTADLPDELTTFVTLMTAPPAPFIPEPWHGRKLIGVIAAYAGPADVGASVVEPLRSIAEPVADLLGPIPYVALQQLVDPLWPKGTRAYMKAGYVRELSDHAIDTLVAAHQGATSPSSEIHLHHMGGAFSRVPTDATAYAERQAPYVVNALAVSHDDNPFEPHVDWARAMYDALEPSLTGGAYINFLSAEGEQRVQAAYGPEKFARLQAVKDEYDPTNVFHLNQNIPPSQG